MCMLVRSRPSDDGVTISRLAAPAPRVQLTLTRVLLRPCICRRTKQNVATSQNPSRIALGFGIAARVTLVPAPAGCSGAALAGGRWRLAGSRPASPPLGHSSLRSEPLHTELPCTRSSTRLAASKPFRILPADALGRHRDISGYRHLQAVLVLLALSYMTLVGLRVPSNSSRLEASYRRRLPRSRNASAQYCRLEHEHASFRSRRTQAGSGQAGGGAACVTRNAMTHGASASLARPLSISISISTSISTLICSHLDIGIASIRCTSTHLLSDKQHAYTSSTHATVTSPLLPLPQAYPSVTATVASTSISPMYHCTCMAPSLPTVASAIAIASSIDIALASESSWSRWLASVGGPTQVTPRPWPRRSPRKGRKKKINVQRFGSVRGIMHQSRYTIRDIPLVQKRLLTFRIGQVCARKLFAPARVWHWDLTLSSIGQGFRATGDRRRAASGTGGTCRSTVRDAGPVSGGESTSWAGASYARRLSNTLATKQSRLASCVD
ncbi:hypothetical protein EVG20_g8257 [Dentipellis fragilis]|uniref:Uncharacterized protein n=1 Tax=Dentipellis fragilis TaxID=205917 RepID=A0A4Y9Y8E6_9AGAM|nr:hypothetical protein EVG20_g8257 [Dentipellis fragilis]